jgi:prepilin-type N-terminal cleavage/methylation domain-containing protein
MKSLSTQYSRQKGFTLTEIIIAIAVISLLILGGIQFGASVMNSGRVSKTADHVRQIASATINWSAGRYNYTGAALATLETQKLLPAGFTAAGTPFGGTYGLTGAGNSFTVTVAGFPDNGYCLQVVDKISKDTSGVPSCAGTTLTAIFGG